MLETEILPCFLPGRRWYADKASRLADISVDDLGVLEADGGAVHLLVARARCGGEERRYFVPLAEIAADDPRWPTAFLLKDSSGVERRLVDALADDSLARAACAAMAKGGRAGAVSFHATCAFAGLGVGPDDHVRPMAGEQSNSSIRVGDKAILKGLRLLNAGVHPEVEISAFLTDVAHYAHAPALLGWAVADAPAGGEPTMLMVLHAFIASDGDAWSVTTDALARRIAGRDAPISLAGFDVLGRRIGELHVAFRAHAGDPAFAREPIARDDLEIWRGTAHGFASQAMRAAEEAGLSALFERRDDIAAFIDGIAELAPSGYKTRVHGDLHLGQLLVAGGDYVVLDMEGEPGRTLADRRRKTSPLRDVAGMIRSVDYAASFAARKAVETGAEPAAAASIARRWRDEAGLAFLKGYFSAARDARPDAASTTFERRLLRFFTLEKALYEVAYEAANRPDWIDIPASSVFAILDGRGAA